MLNIHVFKNAYNECIKNESKTFNNVYKYPFQINAVPLNFIYYALYLFMLFVSIK